MAVSSGKTAGFTLVETVLAMVLVGILTAVAAPRFFARSDFDERFFSDETLSALRYAQKLAVVTSCDTQVDFTTGGFVLNQRATCSSGGFTQSVAHPGTNTPTFVGQAPTGVVLTSDVDPMVFDALGRSLNGTTVSDVSINVGTRSIAIDGETGFVRAL